MYFVAVFFCFNLPFSTLFHRSNCSAKPRQHHYICIVQVRTMMMMTRVSMMIAPLHLGVWQGANGAKPWPHFNVDDIASTCRSSNPPRRQAYFVGHSVSGGKVNILIRRTVVEVAMMIDVVLLSDPSPPGAELHRLTIFHPRETSATVTLGR